MLLGLQSHCICYNATALGGCNTQSKATGDWQGQGCWPVLTPSINNTPDIFSDMKRLCLVNTPCQSNADSGGTWPERAVPDWVGIVCIFPIFDRDWSVWECMCVYTHTHTHTELGLLIVSYVSPGVGMTHLKSPKNPDGPNLGRHIICVYVYKVHMYISTCYTYFPSKIEKQKMWA